MASLFKEAAKVKQRKDLQQLTLNPSSAASDGGGDTKTKTTPTTGDAESVLFALFWSDDARDHERLRKLVANPN